MELQRALDFTIYTINWIHSFVNVASTELSEGRERGLDSDVHLSYLSVNSEVKMIH
jgi:hypothetical protein